MLGREGRVSSAIFRCCGDVYCSPYTGWSGGRGLSSGGVWRAGVPDATSEGRHHLLVGNVIVLLSSTVKAEVAH